MSATLFALLLPVLPLVGLFLHILTLIHANALPFPAYCGTVSCCEKCILRSTYAEVRVCAEISHTHTQETSYQGVVDLLPKPELVGWGRY